MSNHRYLNILLMTAIVVIALNLRPVMAAIGPLLDVIEAETGLSHTQSSLLTTLPVFVMGLCALLGRKIANLCTERSGISLGIALILIACGMRYIASGSVSLLSTAVVAGVGIALAQTLLPAFIKHTFPVDAGRAFALYTTGIMAGAAIAASSSARLAGYSGWSFALSIWAVPALLALILWFWATRNEATLKAAKPATETKRKNFWRNRRAWELMLFFGVGTAAYTLVLAWLPPYYTSLGWQSSEAGFLLGGLTLAEVIAGLAVSAWIGHFRDRRQPLFAALLLLITGLACLIFAPLELALIASLLLGFGIGALFPLSLILTLDHITDPTEAGMLTAFVQGGGYIIASFMPLLAGVMRDKFADLTHAWVAMLIGAILLLILCVRFSPASYKTMNP